MRRPSIVLLTVALGATVAAGLPTTSAAAPSSRTEIKRLNQQRARAGLPRVANVSAWATDCRRHMAYIRKNGNVLTHVEQPGRPGYTPGGAAAGKASVLTTAGSAFTRSGRNQFEDAPIHLMQMLNPWMRRSGAADGCLATLRDVRRSFRRPTTYSYPPDDGEAPARQTAREQPFVPGQAVGLPAGTTTGPYLYFFAAGPDGTYFSYRGRITAAALTGPDGSVPIRIVDATTPTPDGTDTMGGYLPPGGMLIPVSPLRIGARYTATVRFSPHPPLPPLRRRWSFTAVREVAREPDCRIATRKLRRGHSVRGRCTEANGSIEVRMARAGHRHAPGRRLHVRIRSHGRWSARIPRTTRAGRYVITLRIAGRRAAHRTVRVR